MSRTRSPLPAGGLRAALSAAIALGLLAAGLLRAPHVSRAAGRPSAPPMSDDAMQRSVAAFYAAHPQHGGSVSSAVPVDTFFVTNYQFDSDHNLATQLDTVRIAVGQSILWKWRLGSHTTTSGSPGDTTAGSHWDHPINALPADTEFVVTFDTAGTYPFFCRPHGALFNMKGTVIVSPALAVPGPAPRLAGFVAAPWPNPTRAGASFRFALTRAGRADVTVVDAAGRVVATPLAAELPAGTYAGAWSGRLQSGGQAPPGVYFLRLRVPGRAETRRIVLER